MYGIIKAMSEKINGTSDAPSGWAKKAWSWAKGEKVNITDGTNPDALNTREQVITMLHRAICSDVNAEDWSQSALNELDMLDIMDKDNPKMLVSREVMASALSHLIAKIKNGEIRETEPIAQEEGGAAEHGE